MFSYMYKNLLERTANTSLKSPNLWFLNLRYFTEAVRTEGTTESIVSLFKKYGFSETQISSLLNKQPLLLSLNEDKVIKPRLELFSSYGFSSSDMYQIFGADRELLRRSIYNQIIPSVEFLKSVLKNNETVIATIKRSTWVLKQNFKNNLSPNIELLQSYGVQDTRISGFLKNQPRLLMLSYDRFKLVVDEVSKMGFEPVKSHFLAAIVVMAGFSKSTRERRWGCFRKWGWTDDEILSAFMKQPLIIAVSEEKIERVMEFLVNKMGWDASKVSACPLAVMHSLEKWTVPRCLVVQFLLSKGVLKKDLSLNSFLVPMENRFKVKYVDKYCEEFPEVLNLYRSVDNTQKSIVN